GDLRRVDVQATVRVEGQRLVQLSERGAASVNEDQVRNGGVRGAVELEGGSEVRATVVVGGQPRVSAAGNLGRAVSAEANCGNSRSDICRRRVNKSHGSVLLKRNCCVYRVTGPGTSCITMRACSFVIDLRTRTRALV